MISELTFSKGNVIDSITNSSSTVTVDNTQPLSFLEFITRTNVDYTPEEYNNFYIDYLKRWAEAKNTASQTTETNYIQLYVDFLKELIVTYSTQSELKFLTTLDFNDPVELDIAIPIYVEKIRQVVLFYKEKRDNVKYVVDRNKIKGNSTSIEKAIFENIYDYIFSSEQQPQYALLNLSLSSIITNMKIDIEEFVDVYGNYFDLPRVKENETGIRDTLYNNNINDIDLDLYFSTNVARNIIQSPIFLKELPLAINYTTTVDTICDPTNPLLLINNQDNICGFTATQQDDLKRSLISKYIGVDFYYISTLNNTLCSGKFITSQNPTGNLPNLQTPDTATVQSNEIKLLRDLGLFFKPDTCGIFQLNSKTFTYDIDLTKVTEDKVYIFPDPNVYGNVSRNKQDVYPIIYTHDFTKDVKNNSSGFISGDPKVSNYEQTFSPYYSKQQNIHKNLADDASINLNFSDLYNKGYITKLQYDIYGNEYALFKDEFGHTFKPIAEITDDGYILDLLLDGHVFYDIDEGYSFDYSVTGMLNGSIRSGISARTVNNILTPAFTLTGSPYTLFFRDFLPYDEFIDSTRNIQSSFRDGGSFTFEDNTNLTDPVLADDVTYPSSQPYYYAELADGGISSLIPLTRAILDTGIFTYDVKFALSDVNVEDYDCGYFTDVIGLTNDSIYDDTIPFFNSVSTNSTTIRSSLTGSDVLKTQAYKNKLQGKLFVKDQITSTSQPLSTSLNTIFNKYNSSVKGEVYNNIKDFDVIYDTVICETPSYLVFDKIKYNSDGYMTTSTKNTFFTRNSADATNKFSNRFFKEKDRNVTFCIIQEVIEDISPQYKSLSGSNNKILLPYIYQYSITDNTPIQIFPRGEDTLNYAVDLFSLRDYFTDTFNINIVKVDRPIITFNSFNQLYKLTYTCTDGNNMAYIFDANFSIVNNKAIFNSVKFFRQSKVTTTSNFYTSTSGNFVDISAIDGNITLNQGSIIL
jgi:hypothetical protein